MFRPNRIFLLGCLFLFAACDNHGTMAPDPVPAPPTVTATPYHIDQHNDGERNPFGGHNVKMFSPMGQDFVPDLNGLDFVELCVSLAEHNDPSPSQMQLRIREGDMKGPIVGTSDIVSITIPPLNDFEDIVRFVFEERVPLQPQHVYVMEIVSIAGPAFMVGHFNDTYPRGASYVGGRDAWFDMWFREGLIKPSPEAM